MRRVEERDLRSLERPGLYSIFKPLPGDDGPVGAGMFMFVRRFS